MEAAQTDASYKTVKARIWAHIRQSRPDSCPISGSQGQILAAYSTVKASLWPWLFRYKLEKSLESFPFRSEAAGVIAPTLLQITYLLICFRKSTPPQNRQLIVHCYSSKYSVDTFVGDLTFKDQDKPINTLRQIAIQGQALPLGGYFEPVQGYLADTNQPPLRTLQ